MKPDFIESLPHFARFPGRYPYYALRHFRALRDSLQYDWRVHSFPASSLSVVGARATVEDQISTKPGSRITMFSGFSSLAAGFRFQVIDHGSRRVLLNRQVNVNALAGNPSIAPFSRASPFLLPDGGELIPLGGLLIVRIVNMATADNTIVLAVFLAEPRWSL